MNRLPVKDVISGWQLAPETAPPAAWWPQEVLHLTVLDEITGQPPAVMPTVSTTTPGFLARASGTGAGLVGQPLQQFRPAFVTGAQLEIALSGSGFMPLTVSTTIGAGTEPNYPDAFAPVTVPSPVVLHRNPVTISGRTVSHTGVVRTNATVSLDGIWLTLADHANPPASPNLVTLASPLYADRDTTGTIALQSFTPAQPAQTKTLLLPANVGDTSVRLSDGVGLAVDDVMAFDSQDPGRAEYLPVTVVTNLGADATFPATAALAFPLRRPHPLGATAIPMTPGTFGTTIPLSMAARAGDVTLVLSAKMMGLDTPNTVVIARGGNAAAEYHVASLIGGRSDSVGHVVLPPVHRVAKLRLRVTDPNELKPLLLDVMLPLGSSALTVDFRFPPPWQQ
jgi:hypothetical protein